MDKKQKERNEALKKIFIITGVLLVGFLSIFFVLNSFRNYEYKGVKFEQINEKNLVFYRTTLPFYSNEGKKIADYNFYLRTNPNELKNVPFNGNLTLKRNIVFNPNDELNCGGDGIIAVANIVQNLYAFLNATRVIRDENATCDDSGRYTLVKIKTANSTNVSQIGKSCYEINVANCEILKATERYMLEAFVELNKKYNNESN